MIAPCTVRLFDDADGLLCTSEHHPAHTFAATWAADRTDREGGDSDE